MKTIRKFIAVCLISVISAGNFAFAETKATKKADPYVITYDMALERAVKKSLELEKNRRQKYDIEEAGNDLDRNYRTVRDLKKQNVDTSEMENKLYVAGKKYTMGKEFNEKSEDFTKHLLALTIRRLFNSIDSNKRALEILDEQIALKEGQRGIDGVRIDRGMMSRDDYNESENELKLLKKTREQKELEIKKNLIELNSYLKFKDIEKYTFVPIEYTFEKMNLTDSQVETRGYQASYSNISIFAKNNGIKTEQLILDNNLYEGNRSLKQADIEIENAALMKMKDDIMENVKRQYNDISLLGESIDLIELKISDKEKEILNENKKLAVGKTASFPVKAKEVELSALKNSLKDAVVNYETAKVAFNDKYFAGYYEQ